jgi:hypothetical protein
MTSSTEHERHAEEVRARMAGTAGEIRDRMSPGSMVDEIFSYMKDSNGTETLTNLGRQVRDNPLSLALIGAGVAWLFAGPRPVRRDVRVYADDGMLGSNGDSVYPWPDAEDGDVIGNSPHHPHRAQTGAGGLGYLETDGDRRGHEGPSLKDRASGAYAGASDRMKSSGSALSDSAHGASDRMRSAMGGAAHGVSDAGRSAADMASRAGGYVSGAARDTGRYAGSAARAAGSYASDYGHYAADAGRSVGRSAERAAYRARDGVMDALDREPLVVGAIGLAIGAAIGAMLPHTRLEDETFADARDHLRDEAMASAQRGYEAAKDVASESYAAARETADKEGLTGKGDKPLADKVSHVAEAAGKAAKDGAMGKTGGPSTGGSTGASDMPSKSGASSSLAGAGSSKTPSGSTSATKPAGGASGTSSTKPSSDTTALPGSGVNKPI